LNPQQRHLLAITPKADDAQTCDSGMIAIRRRICTPFSGVSAIPATVPEPDVGAASAPSIRAVARLGSCPLAWQRPTVSRLPQL
jgi:hypothetical protein